MPFAQPKLDKSPGVSVPVLDEYSFAAVLGRDSQEFALVAGESHLNRQS